MKRREIIKKLGILSGSAILSPYVKGLTSLHPIPVSPQPVFPQKSEGDELLKSSFGKDFTWGVSTAALQIEGAWNEDGKSESVWDKFSHTKGNIKTGETPDIACDFYHHYPEDIEIIKNLNFDAFRFSLAWSRILPNGTGTPNQKGIDFYHRVIDKCLEKNIQPWVTLYHWDIPQILEEKGGWTNRDVINWFNEYVDLCTRTYGDKVKNWMVLNEPLAFTALGYLLGIHAPGKKGFKNFFPAVHHAAMCQAEGGRIIRANVNDSSVGTTFSCSSIEPLHSTDESKSSGEYASKLSDEYSVRKYDAIINRLFIEPSLGLGYPVKTIKQFKKIYKYMKAGDEEKLKFDFDFIGIQNYTREIIKFNRFIPILKGRKIAPQKRNVEITEMGWEVYPEGIYKVLKKFAAYPGVKKIYVTENGAAFPDSPTPTLPAGEGKVLPIEKDLRWVVNDEKRVKFFQEYLKQVLRAKNEGINVKGYFVWSLMDNFEWAEGYRTRFGLVHVDFKTPQRIIKDSGWWFAEFLKE